LRRTPAHLPEIGLEPGGFLGDRDQLCLAGRREVTEGDMAKKAKKAKAKKAAKKKKK
jgi:hypothetical protein